MFKASKGPYQSARHDRIICKQCHCLPDGKNGTKKVIKLLQIKSSQVDRFWCLSCLNNRIEVSDMIRSFASGTTASLVAKNSTPPDNSYNDPYIPIFVLRPSFRHRKHQNLSTCDDFIHSSGMIFLVPFLATREAVAPLANIPIMSDILIWLFRHLKYQNLSTGDDFIHSIEIIFLVPFLATRELVVPLAYDPIISGSLIRSFRHLEHQNLSIISKDIGRARMV